MFSRPMEIGISLLAAAAGLLVVGYFWWMRRFQRQVPALLPARQISQGALEALERSIGGRIPEAIRLAYLDGSVERVGLPKVYQGPPGEDVVHMLMGADAEANRQLVRWHGLPESAFVFAGDDFGNYFLVKANEEAVYFWGHDSGGEAHEVASSAEAFWRVVSEGAG